MGQTMPCKTDIKLTEAFLECGVCHHTVHYIAVANRNVGFTIFEEFHGTLPDYVFTWASMKYRMFVAGMFQGVISQDAAVALANDRQFGRDKLNVPTT